MSIRGGGGLKALVDMSPRKQVLLEGSPYDMGAIIPGKKVLDGSPQPVEHFFAWSVRQDIRHRSKHILPFIIK